MGGGSAGATGIRRAGAGAGVDGAGEGMFCFEIPL